MTAQTLSCELENSVSLKMAKGLTNTQQEALSEFRKNLSDILTHYDTDAVLLKWLRARNFHVRKAEVYFREFHAFKQVYQFDTIMETYRKPEIAEKYEYTSFLGLAKDGSIIRYCHIGKGDHNGFVMSMSTFSCVMYCSHILESDAILQRKENDRTGRPMNEITYIFDMDGFSVADIMHKIVFEMALDLMHDVQDYYPEVWGNIFVINVPPYFDTVFNFIKPILQLSVIKKLQVLSRESVAETLLKYIDDDVLPVFLGGKKVDSNNDPMCKEFLRFGGKVPKQYYLCNRTLLSPTDPEVKSLWIGPRYVHNHCIVSNKPGSTIKIEFRTENGSIHLKILFRKMDGDKADVPSADEYLNERDEKTNVLLVSPGMRIQSHVSHVDETCKTPWPGIYIFRFDNGHSWFGSRRLIYRIRMIEPESDFVIVP
ncbi:hypothetical protein JTE90_000120 [Oedothorax gibbosus]|uniref:CRAL-TRIO domain-containing protein n=1 Tax=Oedothorax gibbosus TaxID=931172 RepID=A0AAV6V2H8_9ARAC|nr:hypothetical protein JTE90_000120 [Oedothorax gibbosus]